MKTQAVVVAMALFFVAACPSKSASTDQASLPVRQITAQNTGMSALDIRVPIDPVDWEYLRGGLNYVEVSGKAVPVDFCHPGGVAFGPLALTSIAVKDVKRHHKRLAEYDFEDVISDEKLYEAFALLYADMLIRHYIGLDYNSVQLEELFHILQRAWFWGPTIYRKGCDNLQSRERMAGEYVFSMKKIPTPM